MSSPTILDPNGKEVKSIQYSPCPKCGRGPETRVQSGGFGKVYLICPCGQEFKELVCEKVIL